MKYIFLIFSAILLFFPFSSALAQGNARNMMAQSWENYRQSEYEFEVSQVLITDSSGQVTEKEFSRWIHFSEDGDKVAVVFNKPNRQKGLGLLTYRHSQGKDDQFLFMPSWKKVRRISVSDQGKYFAGTDITYEDARQLIGERLDDFEYKVFKSENSLIVIEAFPRSGADTAYAKRDIYLNEKFQIVRIDYYGLDSSGKFFKIKEQINSVIFTGINEFWRVDELAITNYLLNRITRIKVVQRNSKSVISDNIFSKQFLEKAGRQ